MWASVSRQRHHVFFSYRLPDPLAYLTAKTNGLDEVAQEILSDAGLDDSDLEDVPSFNLSTLKPPPIVTSTSQFNWPLLSTGQSFFEKALVNGHIEGEYVNGIDDEAGVAVDDWMQEGKAVDEEDAEEDAAGWDLDTEEIEAQVDVGEEVAETEGEAGAGATPGVSETEMWTRNSPFAADHAAAGSFETAMQVGSLFRSLDIF